MQMKKESVFMKQSRGNTKTKETDRCAVLGNRQMCSPGVRTDVQSWGAVPGDDGSHSNCVRSTVGDASEPTGNGLRWRRALARVGTLPAPADL